MKGKPKRKKSRIRPSRIKSKISKMTDPEKLIMLLILVTCFAILFGYILWR